MLFSSARVIFFFILQIPVITNAVFYPQLHKRLQNILISQNPIIVWSDFCNTCDNVAALIIALCVVFVAVGVHLIFSVVVVSVLLKPQYYTLCMRSTGK